jgi:hypothetical protein
MSAPRLRFAIAAAVASLAIPSAAAAHPTGVHWITLTPGTSSSVRQTTFTGHSGFRLRETAYFGAVNRRCAFLDHINFYVYNIQPGGISGGKAYVWNSNGQFTYNADWGTLYTFPVTHRLGVSRWFCGGQSDGDASVSVEKDHVAGCFPQSCAWHRSKAVYYVP